MFSSNEEISIGQGAKMLWMELFSTMGLLLPALSTKLVGEDGLLVMVLGGVFALLYGCFFLWILKGMEENLLEEVENRYKKIGQAIIGSIYIVRFAIRGGFVLLLFSTVLSTILLKTEPIWVLVFTMLFLSLVGARKEMEERARLIELLYWILVVAFVVLLFLVVGKVEWGNVMPLRTTDSGHILKGGYVIFLAFLPMEWLLFYGKKVADQSAFRKKVLGTILAVLVLMLFIYCATVGLLGASLTAGSYFSSFYMMQEARIPGGFVQRLDIILVGVWVVSMFAMLSGYFHYEGVIGEKLGGERGRAVGLFLGGVIAVCLCWCQSSFPKAMTNYLQYAGYIDLPLSILLPFILCVKKRKKVAGVMVSCFLLCFLTGCRGGQDLEDRNYVLTMGIDKAMEGYEVTYSFADIEEKGEGSYAQPKAKVYSVTVPSLEEAKKRYQLEHDTVLEFGHLKAIIFGDSMLREREALEGVVSYLYESELLPQGVLVFAAENKASELVKKDEDTKMNLGVYLGNMYKNNQPDQRGTTLKDMKRSGVEEHFTTVLKKLALQEDKVSLAGYYFMKQQRVEQELSVPQFNLLELGKGNVPFWSIPIGNCDYKVKAVKSRKEIWQDKNGVTIEIVLTGEVKAAKGSETEWNREVAKKLQYEVNALWQKGIDSIGLVQEIRKQCPECLQDILKRKKGVQIFFTCRMKYKM